MFRNLLYSVFVHFFFALVLYLNTKGMFYQKTKIDITPSITVSIAKNVPSSKKGNTLNKKYYDDGNIAKKMPSLKKGEKRDGQKQEKPKVKTPEQVKSETKVAEKKPAKKVAPASSQKDSLTRPKIVAEGSPEAKNISKTLEEYQHEYRPARKPKPAPASKVAEDESIPAVPIEELTEEEYDDYFTESLEEELDTMEEYSDEYEDRIYGTEDGKIFGSANVIELSLSEKSEIQKAIQYCYKEAILQSGKDSKEVVTLVISIDREGVIDMKNVQVVNGERYGKEGEEPFTVAVDNAKQALVRCNPLRNVPKTKYKVWREMSLEFDGNKLE